MAKNLQSFGGVLGNSDDQGRHGPFSQGLHNAQVNKQETICDIGLKNINSVIGRLVKKGLSEVKSKPRHE